MEKPLYYFFSVHDRCKFLINNWFIIGVTIISFPPLFFNPSILTITRILRIIILFRILKPSISILNHILKTNSLGKILLISVLITIISGISVTFFDSSFRNIYNGIWWSWETITTVGYGDEAPRTLISRIIAIVLMILGTTLFSILTANLSAYFVSKDKKDDAFKRIDSLENKVCELIELIKYERKNNS